MANSSLLQVRVDPSDRERASEILESLGTNLSAVVNMLLKQIIITEGVPFEISRLHGSSAKRKRESVEDISERIEVVPPKPRRIIPAMEYTSVISMFPEGRIVRLDDIDHYFEKKYGVENVEPDYSSGWPTYACSITQV